MIIRAIKTRVLRPPKDDLFGVIRSAVKRIREKSILVVTSKIVSIGEGRCVPIGSVDKDALTRREADLYLPRDIVPNQWVMHTIKNNIFIPSAGIDESNADGHYILWPKNPFQSAHCIRAWLKKTYRLKDIGVVISDSHTTAFRRGTVGISIAHAGFQPLHDYRGKPDIFGRKLTMSQLNIADGLAAAGVLAMGEGREQTPLSLISGIAGIIFTEHPRVSSLPNSSFVITTEEDMYFPLMKRVPWEKGGGGTR